jgi:hypothetical protein
VSGLVRGTVRLVGKILRLPPPVLLAVLGVTVLYLIVTGALSLYWVLLPLGIVLILRGIVELRR